MKELIVINGGTNPQEIYFAHRKGWSVGNDMINQQDFYDLVKSGASYLVIDKKYFTDKIEYYPKIFSERYFDIYKFN